MDLFNQPAAPMQDGWTFDPSKDHKRLTTAMGRVMALMSDGEERTLSEIAHLAKTSEAGASARLRDIRKAKFRAVYGHWNMIATRLHDGQWSYRLSKP
jgi:hypothetical protein